MKSIRVIVTALITISAIILIFAVPSHDLPRATLQSKQLALLIFACLASLPVLKQALPRADAVLVLHPSTDKDPTQLTDLLSLNCSLIC